jgi:hypothetical protein
MSKIIKITSPSRVVPHRTSVLILAVLGFLGGVEIASAADAPTPQLERCRLNGYNKGFNRGVDKGFDIGWQEGRYPKARRYSENNYYSCEYWFDVGLDQGYTEGRRRGMTRGRERGRERLEEKFDELERRARRREQEGDE